jgi:hypothetical protein
MKTMEDEGSVGKTSSQPDKKISREQLMAMTSEVLKTLHHRTVAHRFKPSQHDNPRLAYARATIAAVQAYTTLLRDDEIDSLKRRIEALEKIKDVKS